MAMPWPPVGPRSGPQLREATAWTGDVEGDACWVATAASMYANDRPDWKGRSLTRYSVRGTNSVEQRESRSASRATWWPCCPATVSEVRVRVTTTTPPDCKIAATSGAIPARTPAGPPAGGARRTHKWLCRMYRLGRNTPDPQAMAEGSAAAPGRPPHLTPVPTASAGLLGDATCSWSQLPST